MNFNGVIIWKHTQEMINDFLANLPNIIIAIVVIILFYLFARLLGVIINKLLYKRKKNLAIVFSRLLKFTIIFFSLFIAMLITFPHFNVGDFVTSLGLGSIALGFAFKDIFQNFLAGVLILISEPFKIGDQIIVNDGQYEGTVTKINTRSTYIKTYDGRRVIIPSSCLFKESFIVNTAFKTRRLEYNLDIGYDDDIEKAKSLILSTLADIDDILQDPAPDVIAYELANSSLTLRIRWWTHSKKSEVTQTHDRVIAALKNALVENGYDLPPSTQVVLFHDQTGEFDRDCEISKNSNLK